MHRDVDGLNVFRGETLPDETRLAGWAALKHALGVRGPVRGPACVSAKHVSGSTRKEGAWRVFDKRYWPGDTFVDHLTFALRHETLDLLLLKRIFEAVEPKMLEEFIRKTPTGISSRRAWFLYELLTEHILDIPDDPGGIFVDVLDEKNYFTAKPRLSKRHRVRDNLLGTGKFCPIIRRTKVLTEFTNIRLEKKAAEILGRTGAHLLARAASFLLLADSRASFEIEGERPPRTRLERWGRAVLQAGKNHLTLEEIVRLQSVLIEDARFVHVGLRPDGVFLGERDNNGDPLPEFIGARPTDLRDLMSAMLEANDRMSGDVIDPVLQAAATAFGFVYIHPFQDGNGRIHRCLVHHVLAERKFTPLGMVFPVSSVMYDRIDDYRRTLMGHTGPLMEFIDWRPTPERNVEVLNDTADLYRYFDATQAAEFLYGCVQRTVEQDLPREIEYLRRRDDALRRIIDTVEMPNRLADNLLLFIRQNKGQLPKNRRTREFAKLTDKEVGLLEAIVREAFEDFEDTGARTDDM
ncbi:MAG: Fic family protein [Leptospirales bacterium]